MKNNRYFLLILSILSLLVGGCSTKSDSHCIPANGAFLYANESGENINKIIGSLEKWAIENKLTGITLHGDGNYLIHHERVKKGSNKYLPEYGLGIISDGQITADLNAEENPNWKRYYHSYITRDPKTLNFLDYSGDFSSFNSLINGGYYTKAINKDKNGFEWIDSLSTSNRPIPVNINHLTGKTTIYRIPVRVGDDFKYATLSTNSNYSAFNGRSVKLEDYVTPFKMKFTKAYNYVRSVEGLRGNVAIKGMFDYYNASENGFNEEAWKNVGIKTFKDSNKSYIEFEFDTPCTTFEALTYLSNSHYVTPIPEDFIKTLGNGDLLAGASLWGKFSSDNTLSPIDTYLSTGPYVVEKWDIDQQIVFKKNSFYKIDDRYAIQGVHYAVMPEAANDLEYTFEQFLAGKIDAAQVPSSKIKEYKKDKRVTMNGGSSSDRLNMNTCTSNRWEELFGENGSIYQTPKENYWPVKPAMSNKNFLSGLSFAIDREAIASALDKTPHADFCGDYLFANVECGISYNFTEEHKKASESLLKDTVYGYSLKKAKDSFARASKELIDQGLYKKGETIEIEIAWSRNDQITSMHNLIKEQCEEAFNSSNSLLKLKINSWVGEAWSDVFYKKMMVGQFDLGYGNISSSSSYPPYSYFQNLFSDNRYDFTLNWGADTSKVDESITYDGKYWSYNSLLTALIEGVYVTDGYETKLFDVNKVEVSNQEGGALIVKVFTKEEKLDVHTWARPSSLVLFATTDKEEYSDYDEIVLPIYDENGSLASNVNYDKNNSCYSINIGKDIMSEWKVKYPQSQVEVQGFDLYYTTSLLGKIKESNYINIWKGLFE